MFSVCLLMLDVFSSPTSGRLVGDNVDGSEIRLENHLECIKPDK